MNLSRREFLALTTALAAGEGVVFAAPGEVVDTGPASNYASDGVYDNFRTAGFFIVRHNGKFSAISSICTHRKTLLTAKSDCSFYCRRHGSTFDLSGHALKGPAQRDLPVYATSVDSAGHLLVTVTI